VKFYFKSLIKIYLFSRIARYDPVNSFHGPFYSQIWQACPTGAVHRGHAGFATGAGTHHAKRDNLNEQGQPCARRQNATGLGRGNISPLAQWTLGCRPLSAGFQISTVDCTVAFAILVGQAANSVFALTTN
jgi:hypothetical protein